MGNSIKATILTRYENLDKTFNNRTIIDISANHPKIMINGNMELQSFPNKTGSGTPTEPYIIQNLTIDAGGSGSPISIENTNASLIIQNCTVFSSGNLAANAGINLRYCRNINLSIIYATNNNYGIKIQYCANIIVSDCKCTANRGPGIVLYDGNNSRILNSNASLNDDGGIILSSGYNYIVRENFATLNSFDGFSGSSVRNSSIMNNTFSDNNRYGILIEYYEDNTIGRNNVSSNYGTGIRLESNNYNNTISDNIAQENQEGIWLLTYNTHNKILNNNFSFNTNHGIWSYTLSDHDNIIQGNNITANWGSAVDVEYGGNNTIIGNYITLNPNGIFLASSNNNTISSNTVVSNNVYGIEICENSSFNKILGNTLINNNNSGIYLDGTSIRPMNNTIIGNNASSNNKFGIRLILGGYNSIWGNYFMNNALAQADGYGTILNEWDNGTWGNFWSDYSVRYPTATNDGFIWNTPYIAIAGMDHKPLVIGLPGNRDPSLAPQPDLEYSHGSIAHFINWTIIDTSVRETAFMIYRNGSSIATGTWMSGVPVIQNVDGLTVGVYNYTIIVNDGIDGIVNDTVLVKVRNVSPIISSPSDIHYTVGDSGNEIIWTVTDASIESTSFTIYRNGSSIANGTWISNVSEVQNVDGLDVGSYNFTIVVSDGYGDIAQDVVILIVYEKAAIGTPLSYSFFSFVLLSLSLTFTNMIKHTQRMSKNRSR